MKLNATQQKVFNRITYLRNKFMNEKNPEIKELIGNKLKEKCNYLLKLHKEQVEEQGKIYTVNGFCINKDYTEKLEKYVHDLKDYIANQLKNEPIYINVATGSTGVYDEWFYKDENGQLLNAVDRGEVEELGGN